jgi:hypothetical protein
MQRCRRLRRLTCPILPIRPLLSCSLQLLPHLVVVCLQLRIAAVAGRQQLPQLRIAAVAGRQLLSCSLWLAPQLLHQSVPLCLKLINTLLQLLIAARAGRQLLQQLLIAARAGRQPPPQRRDSGVFSYHLLLSCPQVCLHCLQLLPHCILFPGHGLECSCLALPVTCGTCFRSRCPDRSVRCRLRFWSRFVLSCCPRPHGCGALICHCRIIAARAHDAAAVASRSPAAELLQRIARPAAAVNVCVGGGLHGR